MNIYIGGYILPFLAKKNQQAAGIIIKTRQPDEPEASSDSSSEAIEACAQDLINAVHAHNIKGVADAMKSAFDILESMPHEENEESASPHSYEAQNMKAGV
jgi:hypothetical protein